LASILLENNLFTGTIPEFSISSRLIYLYLSNNTLEGSIPSSIGNLQFLEELFLGNTTLEGPIPTELGRCSNPKVAIFEINNLTGDVSSIINTLPLSLTALELTFNHLSGTIPSSTGRLTDLYFLDLAGNNLNGTIPSELGSLSKLEILALDVNRLTGTVPASLANLPGLRKSHNHSCPNTISPDGVLTCAHPPHYRKAVPL
jgi:Leucine-rich repeat (LRR) protein